MARNGKITLVSNKDGGTSREVTVNKGMTVGEVFYAELGLEDCDDYTVLVNNDVIKKPADHKLNDKDFVVIVPIKVKANNS